MPTVETDNAPTLRQVPSKVEPSVRPIVFEYKKPKKKKSKQTPEGTPKYSPALEDVQIVSGDWLRATRKAVNAFAKGIDAYDRERLRSAVEKKDGAIEDFPYNAGKAVSVWMKEASDIPLDVAESTKRRSYSKRMRKRLRRLSKLLRAAPW